MKKNKALYFNSKQLIFGKKTILPKTSLADLLDESIKKYKYDIAIVFKSNKITYGDLNDKCCEIAFSIRQIIGKQRGIIAVNLNRSIELVATIIAIQKLGCIYLPLSRDIPDERNTKISDDAKPILIITDNNNYKPFTQKDICVNIKNLFSYYRFSNDQSINVKDICYVMYTSGSSGNPKGAMITHMGVVNRIKWMKEYYNFLAGDALLFKAPLNFDVSIWEIFLPLISGGRVIIAEPGKHASTEYIVDLVRLNKINFVHFVPEMLRKFLKERNCENCKSIKTIVCGGEAWNIDLAKDCSEILPNSNIYNGYGPTETSIGVTVWKYDKKYNRKPPIGRPISNVFLLIIDNEGKSVKKGQPGELWIGGISVSPGYINGDVKGIDNKHFVKVNIENDFSIRFYKSGDIVKQLENDEIEYIGRIDNQVKINGTRIELEEIEAITSIFPGVSRTIATLEYGKNKEGKNLVLYFVAEFYDNNLSKKLMSYCERNLPPQVVPGRIIKIEKIPLLANGKLDRHKFNERNRLSLRIDQ